jgi:hypothetical protein
MRENSIYTVTPPDLMLPQSGPIVTVLSPDKKFVDKIEALYENIFNTVSVVLNHPNGKITENNLAWLLSSMRMSDTVYIDLDQLDEIGIALMLIYDTKNVYISERNKKQGVMKLLNNTGKQIFDSIEDYSEYVMEGITFDA